MKFLLDTHCWLWLFTEPDKLRADVIDMIVDKSNDVYVSAATAWEIVIKHALGKLSLPIAPADYVPQRMAAFGHISLAIEQRHTLRVAELPPHHKDPFDRILIAQAQLEGVHFITADRALAAYDVPIFWAQA